MWHPPVAAIGVIFHQQETPAGPQVAAQPTYDSRLIVTRHKVKCIGHHQAIERGQSERLPKVSCQRLDINLWISLLKALDLLAQRRAVLIH